VRLPPTLALARKWSLDRRPPFASALRGLSGSSSRLRPWPLPLGATPASPAEGKEWVFLMFPSESP